MIAINDVAGSRKFFTAVSLLSILDTHLDEATKAADAVVWQKKYDSRRFYEQMAIAANLHTAAKETLKQASARLLDDASVQTLFMLAQKACYRAYAAMELAVAETGDSEPNLFYRDRFEAAWEHSESLGFT